MLYSDINTKDAYKNYQVLDLDSVMQSIRSIINCRRGELLFLPEFGYDGDDYLFEVIDDINAIRIFQEIVNSISVWDDRVILDISRSRVELDIDNNAYKAYLTFKIKGFTETFNLVEPVGG